MFTAGKNEVTYLSNGNKIVADLYFPHTPPETPVPAVVITRPGSGVKEQTAGIYAEGLAKAGYIALAFDPHGFGASEGHKSVEDPYSIAEDTKNSVSFLRTLPEVDHENIHNLGICMGAGYAAYATALDSRVKSVAMISPYLNAAEQILQASGGIDSIRSTLLAATGQARDLYFTSGQDASVQPVPADAEEASQPGVLPIQHGMMGYYLNPEAGLVEGWNNSLSLYNYESLLSFSAFNVIQLLSQVPVFLAVGDEAYTYENTISFFEKLEGEKVKLEIQGASHFDLYWKEESVKEVLAGLDNFLKNTSTRNNM